MNVIVKVLKFFKINYIWIKGCYLTSTSVLANNVLQNQWVFEESFVDDKHAIAVCRQVIYFKFLLLKKLNGLSLTFTYNTYDVLKVLLWIL